MTSTKKFPYIWDEDKNELLKREKGISFEDIIESIGNGGLLEVNRHHNVEKYPNQQKFIVLCLGYVYYIPFVMEGDQYVLKTIVPSRKHKKLYLPSL